MGNAAVSAAPAAAPAAAPTQDYSAQWAAYYRSIGKIGEAEAIEAQARLKQVRKSCTFSLYLFFPPSIVRIWYSRVIITK